jgi:hypothetical protein
VAQWFIYNGYTKVRAIRLGSQALRDQGFSFCPTGGKSP